MAQTQVTEQIDKIKYFKNKKLGKGGYGYVFHGEYNGLPAAVKRVEKSKWKPMREIEILSSLYHPNIVRFYGHEKDDEWCYIAMEKCTLDLRKYLKDYEQMKQELPPEQIMLETSLGLQYLHEKKILHRDIKPDNILLLQLDRGFQVKLADFGFSRFFPCEKTESSVSKCGTGKYKASEILNNLRYRACSDVFSLGVVYYEVLTRRFSPFNGQTSLDVQNEIKQKKLPDLSAIEKPKYHALISKMLQHDTGYRPRASKVYRTLYDLQSNNENGHASTCNTNQRKRTHHRVPQSSDNPITTSKRRKLAEIHGELAIRIDEIKQELFLENTEAVKTKLKAILSDKEMLLDSEIAAELFSKAEAECLASDKLLATVLFTLAASGFKQSNTGYEMSRCICKIGIIHKDMIESETDQEVNGKTAVDLMTLILDDLHDVAYLSPRKKAKDEAYSLKWMAIACQRVKMFEESIAFAERGRAILQKHFQDRTKELAIFSELLEISGTTWLKMGDKKQAKTFYEQYLDSTNNIKGVPAAKKINLTSDAQRKLKNL